MKGGESYLFDLFRVHCTEHCFLEIRVPFIDSNYNDDLCERFWSATSVRTWREMSWLIDNRIPFTIAADEMIDTVYGDGGLRSFQIQGKRYRYLVCHVKFSIRIAAKDKASLFKLFCR